MQPLSRGAGLPAGLSKSFDFLKMHLQAHIPDDVRSRGNLAVAETRLQEGFQQEVRMMCERTNRRNAEAQVRGRYFCIISIVCSQVNCIDEQARAVSWSYGAHR